MADHSNNLHTPQQCKLAHYSHRTKPRGQTLQSNHTAWSHKAAHYNWTKSDCCSTANEKPGNTQQPKHSTTQTLNNPHTQQPKHSTTQTLNNPHTQQPKHSTTQTLNPNTHDTLNESLLRNSHYHAIPTHITHQAQTKIIHTWCQTAGTAAVPIQPAVHYLPFNPLYKRPVTSVLYTYAIKFCVKLNKCAT
jgi:hypothetical protein